MGDGYRERDGKELVPIKDRHISKEDCAELWFTFKVLGKRTEDGVGWDEWSGGVVCR